MKFLLLFFIFSGVFLFDRPIFVHANASPVFFCIGTSTNPPCGKRTPRKAVTHSKNLSQGIETRASSPVSQTVSSASSLQKSCVTANANNRYSLTDKDHDKDRAPLRRGLLQENVAHLLELLQKLFKHFGIPFPYRISKQISHFGTGQATYSQQCPSPVPVKSPASAASTVSPTAIVSPASISQAVSSNCQPNAILENPCRPWFGAAVYGDPHAAANVISQFTYYESIIGHPLDIFHDYHPAGSIPLNGNEIYFAKRSNTYIYVNWKPASNWAAADGGNATINAEIDKAAASIKSIAPHKIFLTIWHEPENDVSPGTSNCSGLKGSAGSPAQYKAMWQNVENRFAADGVTNVVWVMNYMGYAQWDCLVPQLWPGNNLVNWVTYDSYSTSTSSTWANTIGRMYGVLTNDSNNTTNFLSKPWGLAEFGDCTTANQAHVYQYYAEAKAALDANLYPNIKMYMVYDSNGNNAGMGCLTDYSKAGIYDPTEQADFNAFADDPIFLK